MSLKANILSLVLTLLLLSGTAGAQEGTATTTTTTESSGTAGAQESATSITTVEMSGTTQLPSGDYRMDQLDELPENMGGLIDGDVQGWTKVSFGSNNISGFTEVPFSFYMGKDRVSSFRLNPSGLLTFSEGEVSFPSNLTTLPSNGLPNNTLVAYWENLPMGNQVEAYTKQVGIYPESKFLIKWLEKDGQNVIQQAKGIALSEGDHSILFVQKQYVATDNLDQVLGLQQNLNEGMQYDLPLDGGNDPIIFANLISVKLWEMGDFTQQDIALGKVKTYFPGWSNFSPCLNSQKELTVKVTLDLGSDYDFGKNEFSQQVFFTLKVYDMKFNGNLLIEKADIPLVINADKPEQVYLLPVPQAVATQTKSVTVTLQGAPVNALIASNVRVKVDLEETLKTDVRTAPYDEESLITSINVNTGQNPVRFSWETACEGIQGYQLQVLRLRNTNPLLIEDPYIMSSPIDWNNAFTLLIDQPAKNIKLTLAEGTGYYIWRVRPIGNFYAGGVANPKNWGEWSQYANDNADAGQFSSTDDFNYPGAFYYNQFDVDKNFVFSRAIADDLKVVETMGYGDGLLNERQSQAFMYVPSQEAAPGRVVANQSLTDYNGTTVGTTLGAPLAQSHLGYKEKLVTSDQAGQEPFSAKDFDGDVTYYTPNTVQGGPLHDYWSDVNPDPSIANAEGYQYTRTLYKNDGSGRVKEASGIGKALRIGGGHTAQINYEQASDKDEVIPLFGAEAPGEVFKTTTISPDGENHVTLTDANSGKVIASYLVGYGKHPTKDELAGAKIIHIKKHVVEISDPFTTYASTPVYIGEETLVEFEYSFTPKDFNSDCLPELDICYSCGYMIRLTIKKDDETQEEVFSEEHQISPIVCPDGTVELPLSFPVQLPKGMYRVARTIITKEGTHNTTIKDYETALRSYMLTALENVDNKNLFSLLAQEKTDEFYMALCADMGIDPATLEAGQTLDYPVACGTIPIPVLKCAEPMSCEALSEIDFEMMLFEKYPDTPPHLNEFFKINGQGIYPTYAQGYLTSTLYIYPPTDDPQIDDELEQVVIHSITVNTDGDPVHLFEEEDLVFTGDMTPIIAMINSGFDQHHVWASAYGDQKMLLKMDMSDTYHEYDHITMAGGNLSYSMTEFINQGNGSFNAQVANMLSDGYDCGEVYGCWVSLVDAYGSLSAPQEQVEDEEYNPAASVDVDFLNLFLNCTGYTLEGFTNDPAVALFNKHKLFYFDEQDESDSLCLATVTNQEEFLGYPWEAGHEGWGALKSCSEAGNADLDLADVDDELFEVPIPCLEGEPAECLEEYKIYAENECRDRCDERILVFEATLAAYYEDQGINVDQDLLCVTSLIESCKDLCVLTIYETEEGLRLGTDEEIAALMDIWSANPVILGAENGVCGEGSQLTDDKVELADQAVVSLHDDLESLLIESNEKTVCWDYSSTLAINGYQATDCNSTSGICGQGIEVAEGVSYNLYAITVSNYWQEAENFITVLNNGINKGKTKIYLPLGLNYQLDNSGCIYPKASKGAYIEVSYTEESFSMNMEIADAKGNANDLFSCGGSFPVGSWFSLEQSGAISNSGGDYLCLRICEFESCKVVFEQYRPCKQGQEELVTLLNDLIEDGGGLLAASEYPAGLSFMQGQQAMDAKTLYPGGIEITIYSEQQLLDNPNLEEITCYPSSQGEIKMQFFLKKAGKIILDEDNDRFWYRPQLGEDLILPLDCLVPACDEDNANVMISGFACTVCATTSCPQFCLGWEVPVFGEIPELKPTTCEMSISKELITHLYDGVDEMVLQQGTAVKEDMLAALQDPEEEYFFSYDQMVYDYTLYYYDRAGNLVRTIAPNGVNETAQDRSEKPNHGFERTYKYNAHGQITEEHTVDGGTMRYFYDNLGRPRFTQTEHQAYALLYSYIKYDYLQRAIESGEATLEGAVSDLKEKANDMNYPGEQQGITHRNLITYTTAYPVEDQVLGAQRFLRNRVSYSLVDEDGDLSTKNDQYVNRYSYDIQGRISWMITDIPGLGSSRIEYSYDPLSGKVLQVAYNQGQPDQLFHRYEYDAENRLLKTQTSMDGVIWDTDAHQEYYAHGATKRTVIGEDKVQGLDFVYALNGKLKAINHPSLGSGNDPGLDGQGNNTAKDAFGLILGYYQDDFVRNGSPFESTPANTEGYLAAALNAETGFLRESYSGFIASAISNVQSLDGKGAGVLGKTYHYDMINRLTASNSLNKVVNGWESTQDYATTYSYDANGNLLTLNRNASAKVGKLAMDNLSYNYFAKTNRLKNIQDGVNAGYHTTDLDAQGVDNYAYDKSGRLITDQAEGIQDITWSNSNKAEQVVKANGQVIKYNYNPSGFRVGETVYQDGAVVARKYTVRDNGGNVMASYDRKDVLSNNQKDVTYRLLEQPLYAGSRLGVSKRDISWEYNGMGILDEPEITIVGGQMALLGAPGIMVPFKTGLDDLNNNLNDPQLLNINNNLEPNENFNMVDVKIDRLGFENNIGTMEDDIVYNGLLPINLAQGMDGYGAEVFKFYAPGKMVNSKGEVIDGYQGILADDQGRSLAVHAPQTTLYYLFTQHGGMLYYHVVDMSVKGNGTDIAPAGRVISKNIPLAEIGVGTYAIAAIEYQHEAQIYAKRRTDENALIEVYTLNHLGLSAAKSVVELDYEENTSAPDNMEISSDGRHLAITSCEIGELTGKIRLFTLDMNGMMKTGATLALSPGNLAQALAFSPSNGMLYYSSYGNGSGGLYKTDVAVPAPQQLVAGAMVNAGRTDLYTGTDGKVYLATHDYYKLQVVSNPDGQPVVSKMTLAGLNESPKLSGGLPKLAAKCSKAVLSGTFARTLGEKQYELKDQIGNVRAVITDVKLSVADVNIAPYNFKADIMQYDRDFYPYGMVMPGMNGKQEGSNYSFGFQGMEKQDELAGEDNSYNTLFRMYDPRVGRWLSTDPVTNHSWSPYNGLNNNPVNFTDPFGDVVTDTNGHGARFKTHLTNTIASDKQKAAMAEMEYEKFDHKRSRGKLSVSDRKAMEDSFYNARNYTHRANQYQEALDEYVALENSPQEYNIRNSPSSVGINTAVTEWDPSSGAVMINIDPSVLTLGTKKLRGLLAHELKHAYQFETGKVSFIWMGGANVQAGILSDLEDEVEGYERGQLFGENTGININSSWVLNRTSSTGVRVYAPFAGRTTQTTLNTSLNDGTGRTHRDVMRAEAFNLGATGQFPAAGVEIYNGFSNDFEAGFSTRPLPINPMPFTP